MTSAKELKLPDPFPSAPSKTASIVMRFYNPENRNDVDHLWVIGFTQLYAARVFFDEVFKGKYKWLSEKEVAASNTVMKSDDIDSVVNYKLKGKEKEWDLPEPYSKYARCIRDGIRLEGTKKKEVERKATPKKPISTGRQRTPAGLVSLADVCSDLGIEAREARAILRKSPIKKPSHGWSFEPDKVEEVKKAIKRGMK